MSSESKFTQEQYESFLAGINNSIESLLVEIDSEIMNNFHCKVPMEYRYDMVPVLKKLQATKKELDLSISLKATKSKS